MPSDSPLDPPAGPSPGRSAVTPVEEGVASVAPSGRVDGTETASDAAAVRPPRGAEGTEPEAATRVPDSTSVPPPRLGLVVGVLVLASSTSIMSTDMYAPSLPDLVEWFDTTPTAVKLTISLNMLAFAVAQLVHGPLSDRFGRRPVLLGSLVAVAVASLVCAFAQTIGQLVTARVALGLAAGAEAVIGLAVIKDLYDERRQIKALALLGMVIAIAPAAAPILGGYLHVAFGWQSNFHVIAAMALLSCLVIARLLPESTRPDPGALAPARVIAGYARLLVNADFTVHSAMLGVAMGLIFVFITGAPFVLIEYLGVAIERFGYYQAAIVIAFFLGSVLASRQADRWPGERLLRLGVSLIVIGAIALAVVVLGDLLTPERFAASYSVMTFGMGSLFAVAPSRALRSIEGRAGTASALLSGIEQGTAALAAVTVSLAHDGTARPLAWLTLALAAALVALAAVARRAARR